MAEQDGFDLGFGTDSQGAAIQERLERISGNVSELQAEIAAGVTNEIGPIAADQRSLHQAIGRNLTDRIESLRTRNDSRRARIASAVAAESGRARENTARSIRLGRELGILDDPNDTIVSEEAPPDSASQPLLATGSKSGDAVPLAGGIESGSSPFQLDSGSTRLADGQERGANYAAGIAYLIGLGYSPEQAAEIMSGPIGQVGFDFPPIPGVPVTPPDIPPTVDPRPVQPQQPPVAPGALPRPIDPTTCRPIRTQLVGDIEGFINGRPFPAGSPLFGTVGLGIPGMACLGGWIEEFGGLCRESGVPLTVATHDDMAEQAFRRTLARCQGDLPADEPQQPDERPEQPEQEPPQQCTNCGCCHPCESPCPPGSVCPTAPMPPRPEPEPLPPGVEEEPEQPEQPLCELWGIGDDQWVAWYNTRTQQCAVSQCPNAPTGNYWFPVGVADDAPTARLEARQYCQPASAPWGSVGLPEFAGLAPGACAPDYYYHWVNTRAWPSQSIGDVLSRWFGSAGDNDATWWINRLFNISSTSDLFFKSGSKLLAFYLKRIETVIQMVIQRSGCSHPAFFSAWSFRVILGFLERWISPAFGDLALPWTYTANQACPVMFPSHTETIQAWLTGDLSDARLESWLRMNNKCPQPFQSVVASQRAKFDWRILAIMRRRHLISEEEYNARIRRLGFIGDTEADLAFTSTEQRPPLQDIIRYMVRDVNDQQVVDDFDLDADFDRKFGGQLQEWSTDQGIPEEVAKFSWRAHWVWPAPSQLYEMLHRLRPGRVDPAVEVTPDTVRQALQIQDVNPTWIDKYLKVAYRPLTRVDVRRAFNIGAIDRAEVKESYLDLGYDDQNAEKLTEFAEKLQENSFKGNPANAQFVEGVLSEAEWRQELIDDDAPTTVIDNLLPRLKRQRTRPIRTVCTKEIKDKYRLGEIDEATATGRLISIGWATDYAPQIVDQWDCERKETSKQASIGQLCDWFARGSLTIDDFMSRLKRIGWDDDDATRIIVECQSRINERKRRQAEREAKEAAAAAKRTEREESAAIRRQQSDIRRRESQIERMTRASIRRDKAITKAAEKYAKAAEIPLDEAIQAVKAAWLVSGRDYPLGLDERIAVVSLAVDAYKSNTGSDLEFLTSTIARQFIEFPEQFSTRNGDTSST